MTNTKTIDLTDQQLGALASGGVIWIDEEVSISEESLGVSAEELVAGATATVGDYLIRY